MVKSGERVFVLDLWRVIAIVLVFCFHAPRAWTGDWSRVGWMGVDLFFVLSGYLIGRQILSSLSRERFSFRSFYASRSLRTLPVYFVVLAAYFLWPEFRERPELFPLWKFLTFTLNFGLTSSAFSHAWSLCVEEQFYLVAPFALMLVWRTRVRAVVLAFAVIGGGFLYRHFTWLSFSLIATPATKWDDYLTMIYFPTWGRLDGLVFGVVVAGLRLRWLPGHQASADLGESLDGGMLRGWRWFAFESPWPSLILGAALLDSALRLFADRLSYSATMFGYPLLSLAFAVILNGSLSFTFVLRSSSTRQWLIRAVSKLVSAVAILSYSFYLIHKQVIHGLRDWSPWVAFAASLLVASLMYLAIERPFLRLRSRVLRRLSSPGLKEPSV